MCLAVVAIAAHPRFALVVAANRDEAHARRAAPAQWWNERAHDGILAGRDLSAGGTWLGVTRRGRWAFVTNVREPGRHDPGAPSRGALVVDALDDARTAETAVAAIHARAASYNGYNLIAGDLARASWASNRVDAVHVLDAGVHGVSNARLDTPWPKLERARAGMRAWAAMATDDVAPLLAMLADRTQAPDDALPATGVSREWERLLSAPFIVSERYGTRCSTVLTIAHDGASRFVERSFDATGAAVGEVEHRFEVEKASG